MHFESGFHRFLILVSSSEVKSSQILSGMFNEHPECRIQFDFFILIDQDGSENTEK